MKSLSRVRLFATPWTIAHQAPLSMGFSRQEYWSGLPFPFPREKERYIHFNAEFQKIARRYKKAFLSNQCKEIEENNRMRKTRELFKKIRDTKGPFHAKMSAIKDRNDMDLTEAEGIKKRWQEYTEELCKKDLHDPDDQDGVITYLEPDTLECEVKGALGSVTRNKDRGGYGIPVEPFHIFTTQIITMV